MKEHSGDIGGPSWLGIELSGQRHNNDRRNLERAITILHNMALERRGWRHFFSRWYISDEPLRNDAARFLKELGVVRMVPMEARIYDPDQRTKDAADA